MVRRGASVRRRNRDSNIHFGCHTLVVCLRLGRVSHEVEVGRPAARALRDTVQHPDEIGRRSWPCRDVVHLARGAAGASAACPRQADVMRGLGDDRAAAGTGAARLHVRTHLGARQRVLPLSEGRDVAGFVVCVGAGGPQRLLRQTDRPELRVCLAHGSGKRRLHPLRWVRSRLCLALTAGARDTSVLARHTSPDAARPARTRRSNEPRPWPGCARSRPLSSWTIALYRSGLESHGRQRADEEVYLLADPFRTYPTEHHASPWYPAHAVPPRDAERQTHLLQTIRCDRVTGE